MTVMTPMDADEDVRSSSSSSSLVSASSHPPSYRCFIGDSEGTLKTLQVPCPPIEDGYEAPLPVTVKIDGKKAAANSDSVVGSEAVQKMAGGQIDGVGWVMAIARKNATIDIVLAESSDTQATQSSDSQGQSSKATLLATIVNERMKAGLQRWVGLAVSSAGIYACTSAGDFSYTSLDVQAASSSSTVPRVVIEGTQRLELPEPLQSLIFYPTTNPSHFFYGGEEIPLSMWHIQTALSPPPAEADTPEETNGTEIQNGDGEASNGHGTAKMRKRKRQAEARAKSRELLWGEVWRAKNLPNDALSLPRRPNITSIAVLATEQSTDVSQTSESSLLASKMFVGTRDGLLRTFEPASGVRKHTLEMRVVTGSTGSQQSALKALYCTSSQEVVAADGSGKLYALDWQAGKIKYQWKDINGAISSIVSLPAPSGSTTSSSSLLSCSMDRLVRLHSLPDSASVNAAKTAHGARGQTLLSVFTGGSAATAAVWDGRLPRASPQSSSALDVSMEARRNSNGRRPHRQAGDVGGEDSDDEDADDVWEAMQEVGDGVGQNGRESAGRSSATTDQRGALRRKSGNSTTMGVDEDGDDVEAVEKKHSDKSKRSKQG